MGTYALEPADEHAEPGGVEKVDALHVDDQVVATVVDKLDQLLAQLGRGIYINLATDLDDRAVANGPSRQGQVHGSSSTLHRAVAPHGSAAAMAFNHLPAGVHDALSPLSVRPVTHSVSMAHNQLPRQAGIRPSPRAVLDRLGTGAGRGTRITHTEHLPPRLGSHADWPTPIRQEVIDAIRAAGIERPWAHQARTADH